MPNLTTRVEQILQPASDDWVHIVDVSDTTDDPNGSDKKIKYTNFIGGLNPLTTKGDLITYDISTTRLPVGANDQVLIADSADPKGIRWSNGLNVVSIKTQTLYVGTGSKKSSAIAEAESTTQGFLIPRMTTVQKNAISSPADTLLVNDTDLGLLQKYDLANTRWDEIDVNKKNYVFAYDNTTQTPTVVNTFKAINFANSTLKDGWTHTPGTSNFTCNKKAIYSIEYQVTAQKTAGGNRDFSISIFKNSAEIIGSTIAIHLNTDASPQTIKTSILASLDLTNILDFRIATSNARPANMEITPYGPSGTNDISAQVKIIRIS